MVLARFRWFQLVLDCIFIIEICQFHNTIVPEINKGIFQIKNDQHKFRSFFFSFFFLSGFSFTNIHESQDCRGRGRVFL